MGADRDPIIGLDADEPPGVEAPQAERPPGTSSHVSTETARASAEAYSRRVRPLSASRIALGRRWPPVGPGTTRSSCRPSRRRTSRARRAGGAAAVFALVETMAPPNPRHSPAATGWAVTRTATRARGPLRLPVTAPGTPARAGTSHVTGGSDERRSRTRRRSTQSIHSDRTNGSRCSHSAPIRMRPFAYRRRLTAAIRRIADSDQGSHPSPNTASVG